MLTTPLWKKEKNRRKNHSSIIFFLLTSNQKKKTPPHNYTRSKKIETKKKSCALPKNKKGKNKTQKKKKKLHQNDDDTQTIKSFTQNQAQQTEMRDICRLFVEYFHNISQYFSVFSLCPSCPPKTHYFPDFLLLKIDRSKKN